MKQYPQLQWEEVPAMPLDASPARPTLYLMTPVADEPDAPAERIIRTLLDQHVYVFGDRTPGRRMLNSGDHICFYQAQVGVVAEATVVHPPERTQFKYAKDPERFPWSLRVKDVRYFFDKPIVIDAGLRTVLDAFKRSDPQRAWGWFVQATRLVTAHDFELLVGSRLSD